MSKNFQLKLLESLIVERARACEDVNLLNEFTNKTNSGLSDILTKGNAKQFDVKNEMAVYIICTSNSTLSLLKENGIHLKHNVILLYFALRPGLLYKPLFQTAPSHEMTELYDFMLKYTLEDVHEKRSDLFSTFSAKHPDIDPQLLKRLIIDYAAKSSLSQKCPELFDNQNGSNFQKYVEDSFGAVELVLFCANQSAKIKNLQDKIQLTYRMGELLYWNCIFPIIRSAVEIIGGQYVYLFAADNGILTNSEHTLVDYYKDYLDFSISSDLSTVKPNFDHKCVFMYQEIKKAENHYQDFKEALRQDDNDDARKAVLI